MYRFVKILNVSWFRSEEKMKSKVAMVVLIALLVGASASLFWHFRHEGKFILKPVEPTREPEALPEGFLPPKFPWVMRKSNAESDMFYPSFLPRKPEVVFSIDVSANLGGTLANAMVDGDKIFLADGQGVYALHRDNGELVWGVEVYSDSLEGRAISHPQPVTKWRALGLWRFVRACGVGNFLYVATSSNLDLGDAFLLALSKENGSVEWMVELESEAGASSRSSVTSNLVVADGRIYVGSVRDEGYVFCVGENGALLWRSEVGGIARGLACGDGILFVTSEPSTRLHALDPKTGETLWIFEHDAMLSAPSYRDGKVVLADSQGGLLSFSSEGKLLWRRSLGVGGDVNCDPYVAVGAQRIYAVRSIGERPLNLFTVDLDGNVGENFTMESDEDGGKPVASRDVVVLPVRASEEGKVHLLWRGWAKTGEFSFPNDGWMPVVSAAYGEIYVLANPGKLYKLADIEKPVISSVKAELLEENLVISVTACDSGSALYRVLLVYSVDGSAWSYAEMEVSRRYAVEPVGGYGLEEEVYGARIPLQPDTTLEFYVVAVDHAGNYEVSGVRAYQVSKG